MTDLASFQISSEILADGSSRAVVEVCGEIDMSNAGALHDAIVEAWKQTRSDVVVDVAAVRFIGSDGINALVRAAGPVRAGGHELVLRKPSALLLRVLTIMALDATLPVVD